jgi:3-oxoacyl-[acyl-carrier protein] reductase
MSDIGRRYPGQCQAIAGDVSKPDEVNRIFAEVLQTHSRIDVLINNAGVGEFDDFTRLSDVAWRAMIDINLMGAVWCTRQALGFMRGKAGGMIVNVSSVCGLRGFAQCTAYCASKFALLGFSEALAKETAGREIFVYAICPDITHTGFAGNRNASLTRPARMLTAEEVAAFIHDLTARRPPPQICSLKLHPLSALCAKMRIDLRKIAVKRVRLI